MFIWCCRVLNTNCTHLWSLGHPLHTHTQTHLWLSKTPTLGCPNTPKSCGKIHFGYKKHACNSWGCSDIPTRSGWSPPHGVTVTHVTVTHVTVSHVTVTHVTVSHFTVTHVTVTHVTVSHEGVSNAGTRRFSRPNRYLVYAAL